MDCIFRKATESDILQIWSIIQKAIIRRRIDGSTQWQDGYPNLNIINTDIANDCGFVLVSQTTVVGYIAIFINYEPAYEKIKGTWLSHGQFVAIHRLAVAEAYLGKGFAKQIINQVEQWAIQNKIYSIKADTNFDNQPMLKIFSDLGFVYCGEVTFRGNSRKAFEKVLILQD